MYFDSFDSIRSAIFQLKQRRAVCLCSRLRSADGKSNVDTCAKEVNREILAANQNRRGIESVFGHSFRFLRLSPRFISYRMALFQIRNRNCFSSTRGNDRRIVPFYWPYIVLEPAFHSSFCFFIFVEFLHVREPNSNPIQM